MTDRDLTPEEARAEIEAFMGEGWSSIAIIVGTDTRLAYTRRFDGGYISVEVEGRGPTYRAAVSALKAAWRDAVRPWCARTLDVADDAIVPWECGGGGNWAYQTEQGDPLERRDIIARTLKEDSK